jgi:hypothetical protein
MMELVDVSVAVHHRTEKAILVSTDGNKQDAVWVPLSQVEIEDRGRYVVLTMPAWLAIEKRLA